MTFLMNCREKVSIHIFYVVSVSVPEEDSVTSCT